MKKYSVFGLVFILFAVLIEIVQPTCVLESDFGFKINCAFKKSGLFRVRNLGGLKAHASIGFSLGDELGFEQSLTNLDPSRRRSVNVKNGAPPNVITQSTPRPAKQEKRGKQNRIMMRPIAPVARPPNQAGMDKLSTLHRRLSTTMQPIVVPPVETRSAPPKATPTITLAKPIPMGVPAFKPLPPKEDTLKVLPIVSSTKTTFTPLQIPQSKGPGLVYQSENYPQSHNQISKMVSQMTAVQYAQPLLRITPAPIIINTPKLYPLPTTVNPFIPMPVAAPPTQAISIIPAPVMKQSAHSHPQSYYPILNTISVQNNPLSSNFIDPVPQQVQDLASSYAYKTKKIDEYNTITGYGDDTTLKFNKEDINSKIVEIAKAGNISMDAVEAAIALRQQQLLTKYANMAMPSTTTTTTTTTTTEEPLMFQPQPEPEIIVAKPQTPKRTPTLGKVMNAPREYYPVGYEKNFDDHFQTKVDLPETDFHCGDQKYFPGLYGDESLGCMVFHVCALTDDGLVMKSFLCPESTLFDQTILKCNWWFYVDCKSTRRLYDTNIPVSKSYQLMKALTFFSSYKKDIQEEGRPTNSEDVEGIKEAISILENQDNTNAAQTNVQVITPQPIVDERNNHKTVSTENTPVYRGTRNYGFNSTRRNPSSMKNKTEESSTDFRLITVNADMNVDKNNKTNSTGNTSSESAERKYRRRMTLKNTPVTSKTTDTTSTTTTLKPVDTTSSSLVEIIKQEIQPIEMFTIGDVKQEKLTDELEASYTIDAAVLKETDNSPPVKRFYRSSAEKDSTELREVAYINNEKIQIVRPTSMARLVGDSQTPSAVIAKLDQAVLGSPRFKKSVTIVTPINHENYRIHTNQT